MLGGLSCICFGGSGCVVGKGEANVEEDFNWIKGQNFDRYGETKSRCGQNYYEIISCPISVDSEYRSQLWL